MAQVLEKGEHVFALWPEPQCPWKSEISVVKDKHIDSYVHMCGLNASVRLLIIFMVFS